MGRELWSYHLCYKKDNFTLRYSAQRNGNTDPHVPHTAQISDFPGGLMVKSKPPLKEVSIPSLVRELRSFMPLGVAKINK